MEDIAKRVADEYEKVRDPALLAAATPFTDLNQEFHAGDAFLITNNPSYSVIVSTGSIISDNRSLILKDGQLFLRSFSETGELVRELSRTGHFTINLCCIHASGGEIYRIPKGHY